MAEANQHQREQEPEAPTYHRDRLVTEAQAFFGHPPHVVVGALEHIGGNKKNFSLDEVEKAIKDWLRKPVEVEKR